MIRPKYPQYSNFVTSLELRAAYAILPRFERESPALHHVKAHSVEKIYNVGKSKDGVEFILFGFGNQGLDEFAADPLGFGMLMNGEGTDFSSSVHRE
jgi:hypothetical protein